MKRIVINIFIIFIIVMLVISQFTVVFAKNAYDKYKDMDFSKQTVKKLNEIKKELVEDTVYQTAIEHNNTVVIENTKKLLNLINKEIDNKSGTIENNNGDKITVSIKDSEKDKKKYTSEQISEYKKHFGIDESITTEILEKWKETLKESGTVSDKITLNEIEKIAKTTGSYIYKEPTIKDNTGGTGDSIDGIIEDGDNFLKTGKQATIEQSDIQNLSRLLYNSLLSIAVVVSVIVGGIIGIKLMTGGIEEKAETKQFLIPYLVGCIVVFGAFGIWKLVVTILQTI